MDAVILPKEAYQQILTKLDAISTHLSKANNPSQEQWLNNKEVCLMLNVSSRTLQNYRDEGILPFSQHGHKILYKLSDIQAHLNKGYVKPFVTSSKS